MPADIHNEFASPAGAFTAAGAKLDTNGGDEVPLLLEESAQEREMCGDRPCSAPRRILSMAYIWDANVAPPQPPQPPATPVWMPGPVIEAPPVKEPAATDVAYIDVNIADIPVAALALK